MLDGQYVYQFYDLDGERHVQVTEKATTRSTRLRAAFGKFDQPAALFAKLEEAFVAKAARLVDIGFGVATPLQRVVFRIAGVDGSTPEKPLYVVWEAGGGDIQAVAPRILVGKEDPKNNPSVARDQLAQNPEKTTDLKPDQVPPPQQPTQAQPSDPAHPKSIVFSNAVKEGDPVLKYEKSWDLGTYVYRIEYKEPHHWAGFKDELLVAPFLKGGVGPALLGDAKSLAATPGVQLFLDIRQPLREMYAVIALNQEVAGIRPGLLVINSFGTIPDGSKPKEHPKSQYYINQINMSFVAMPKDVKAFQPKPGGDLVELTPSAQAIAALQADLIMKLPAIFPGLTERWVSEAANQVKENNDQGYRLTTNSIDMTKPVTIFQPFRRPDGQGGSRLSGIVLARPFYDNYLKTDEGIYPYWVMTPKGELWAPFDREITRLPAEILKAWVEGEVQEKFPDLIESLQERGGYIPLSIPKEDNRSVLIINRRENHLYVLKETEESPNKKRVVRADFPLPEEIGRTIAKTAKTEPLPTLVGVPSEDSSELLLTVPEKDRGSYLAASDQGLYSFPLWMIRRGASRATALFGFRQVARVGLFGGLLDPAGLNLHPAFKAEVRDAVESGGAPLEPVKLGTAGGAWDALFIQRIAGKPHLVAIREDQPAGAVRKVAALIPDDLDAALAAAGEHAEVELGGAGVGGSILVGFRRSKLVGSKFSSDVKKAGPLWILRGDESRRPLRALADDDWDQPNETLTRPAKLAGDGGLVEILFRRSEGNKTLAILPFGRGGDVRYLYRPGESGQLGWLVRVAAQKKSLAVRVPPTLAELIEKAPNQVRFRQVGDEAEPALLAAVDKAQLDSWVADGRGKPDRPWPLWWLSEGRSGAPFLATRPDGMTPAEIEPGLLELDATPRARVRIYRELASRQSVRLLSRPSPGRQAGWIVLEPDGQSIWNLVEADGPAPLRVDQFATPATLRDYLVAPKADLGAVQILAPPPGPPGVAILWLEGRPGVADPRGVFQALAGGGEPPYPLWVARVDRAGPIEASAVFSARRDLEGAKAWEAGKEGPPAYRPRSLAEQPDLVSELLGVARAGNLWRSAPPGAEADGSILHASRPETDGTLAVLVEHSVAPGIGGRWRRFRLGQEVRLAEFLAEIEGNPGRALAGPFGKALRALPAGSTLWWAQPGWEKPGKADGSIGYATGPESPPSGPWSPSQSVRLAYVDAAGAANLFARPARELIAESRSQRGNLPELHRKMLGGPEDRALELGYLRFLAREVIWLAGDWNETKNRSFQGDPGQLFWREGP